MHCGSFPFYICWSANLSSTKVNPTSFKKAVNRGTLATVQYSPDQNSYKALWITN